MFSSNVDATRLGPEQILIVLACFLASGCQREGEITTHVIPKSESNLELIRDAAGQQPPEAGPGPAANSTKAAKDARMVVAIADRPNATWYFKISGPMDQVAATKSQWKPFFEQLTFGDDGNPVWDLPEGWKELGAKPMRFATLAIGDSTPPLELAVSSLAAGQDMLANVNRWRGQLGLQPTSDDALESQLQSIDADGQMLTVFDETGQLGSSSMMPPFAQAMNQQQESTRLVDLPAEKTTDADRGFEYETPTGWIEGPSSSIVLARLLKEESDQKVQISVVTLPAAANEWEPNVVRWAREVGMESEPKSELNSLASEVEVDGLKGQVVRLLPGSKDQTRGTIAAMIKQGPTAWFFKLTGDKTLVSKSSDDFEAFLKSVELP